MKKENSPTHDHNGIVRCVLDHALIPGWAISTGQIPLAIRRVVKDNNRPAAAIEENEDPLGLIVNSIKFELSQKSSSDQLLQFDINPLCLFGLTICFTDLHDRTFPPALYPPSSAISSFIERVLANNRPVELWEQFRFGLEDTNHPVEAGLACMWASRIMARDLDRRAYPQIKPDPNAMREWNRKLTPLPSFEEANLEPSGDTYYFWTSACMALVIENGRKQHRSKAMLDTVEAIYQYGAEIMVASRLLLARQKMASSHKTSAALGYAVGWSLAQHIIDGVRCVPGVEARVRI